MRAMRLRHSSRGVIALLTAVLFLLCQTAFAAQACAHTYAAGDSSASGDAAPCHDAERADAAPHAPATLSSCDAPKAVSGDIKFPVIAIADRPALTVAANDALRTELAIIGVNGTQAVCYSPPPLNLLHCRFLK